MSEVIDEFVSMGNMLSREHAVSRTCRNRLLNQDSKCLFKPIYLRLPTSISIWESL